MGVSFFDRAELLELHMLLIHWDIPCNSDTNL